jgi:hypothetical protein
MKPVLGKPVLAPGIEWNDEHWSDFYMAADSIASMLDISVGLAQVKLRQLCATGEVRALEADDVDGDEGSDYPTRIPPSRWRTEDVDFIGQAGPDDRPAFTGVVVSDDDLRYWLDRQQPEPPASPQPDRGGKQSRIHRVLAELYPDGVPGLGDCPRQRLTAELIKRDTSLGSSLSPATVRTAIATYNRQLANGVKR